MQTVTDEDDLSLPSIKFEYLDHPADVQLHSWGDTLQESFEQVAMAMFGYITDMDYVDMDHFMDCEVKGDDMLSLLFLFLDELLFNFCADPFFIAKKVSIINFDRQSFTIKVRSYGEPFDLEKHTQGTEVKAITYSNMQVHEDRNTNDIFVIVDI